MRLKVFILIVLLCCGAGLALWDRHGTPSPLKPSEETKEIAEPLADLVPDMNFRSLKGEDLSFHDFKGKVLVINIWATWCPPCVAEFPSLIKLAKTKEKDLVLLALSVDSREEDIKRFLGKAKLPSNVIIAHDRNKKISLDAFQTVRYPETYIIGRDLRIIKKVSGPLRWDSRNVLSYFGTL